MNADRIISGFEPDLIVLFILALCQVKTVCVIIGSTLKTHAIFSLGQWLEGVRLISINILFFKHKPYHFAKYIFNLSIDILSSGKFQNFLFPSRLYIIVKIKVVIVKLNLFANGMIVYVKQNLMKFTKKLVEVIILVKLQNTRVI